MSNADKSLLEAFGAQSIDNIDIVPGFKTPPSGEYEVYLEAELKVINSKPNFILKGKLKADDPEPVDGKPRYLAGDQFSQMFGKEGLEYNRDFIATVMQAFGATTLGGCVEAGTIEAKVTIQQRDNDKDPDKPFAAFKKITV